MNITDQLPQRPAPYPPLHVVTPRVTDQKPAARLEQERDQARHETAAETTRANLAEKAGVEIGNALVATIRRETQLTTRLRIALAHVRELEQLLDDKHLEARRVAEHVARLVADNTDLRTELANQPRGWFRRRTQDH